MCDMLVFSLVTKRTWILQYARWLLTPYITAVYIWYTPDATRQTNVSTLCAHIHLLQSPWRPKYILHISRSFADVITRAHIRKPIIIPFLWRRRRCICAQGKSAFDTLIFLPLFPIRSSFNFQSPIPRSRCHINQRDTSRYYHKRMRYWVKPI